MEYEAFLRAVAAELGLDWRKYRRRMARRAVQARLRELGLGGLGEYLAWIRADPEEARTLPDRMRVTVTRFLRERRRWDVLFERVLPELVAGKSHFRVWSAGCCGGEEPYTFSLLWLEHMADRFPGVELEILATDIDPATLDRAAVAEYEPGVLREVPDELRSRWFEPTAAGRRWTVREPVRAPVRFLRHNIMEDDPPTAMDLVLCRYLVFTYYRAARRGEAVRRLHSALRPWGVLVVGRKEGLTPYDREWFHPWPGAPGVLRRP